MALNFQSVLVYICVPWQGRQQEIAAHNTSLRVAELENALRDSDTKVSSGKGGTVCGLLLCSIGEEKNFPNTAKHWGRENTTNTSNQFVDLGN